MNKQIELLKSWGCDVDSTMERMLDDEEFYLECVRDIPGDECFVALISALKGHDVKAAFDAAHTLKGVLANLALTPMYDKVVEIVEPLRAGDDSGLLAKADELIALRDRLKEILAAK